MRKSCSSCIEIALNVVPFRSWLVRRCRRSQKNILSLPSELDTVMLKAQPGAGYHSVV